MLRIDKAAWVERKGKDISKQPFFRWLWSFDLEGKVARHLVHEA